MYQLDINDIVTMRFPNKSQFAKAIGVSREAAIKLCNGETTRISFSTITAICKALECTPNDIFSNDEDFSNQRLHNFKNLPPIDEKALEEYLCSVAKTYQAACDMSKNAEKIAKEYGTEKTLNIFYRTLGKSDSGDAK